MAAAAKLPSLVSSAIASARPKFNIFMKYAKVELAPPKLSEIPQIKAGLGKLISSAKSGAWKQQTVKQASLNLLVGAEVIFWFYVGECIGKRHIVAAIASARPKFNIFMKYTKVELAPPKLSEIPQIKAGLGKLISSTKSGAWKQQTVKQASLNFLVGAEVIFWFYVGECIGKRHIVGYKV